MKMTKLHRSLGIALATLTLSTTAEAANWLMLQGTEPTSAAGRAKVWGFIQAQYQHDFSDAHDTAGTYIPPKLIGPNLTTQSAFNVNRARIGVRGGNFPLDSKTNYFILGEFGNNGITASNAGGAHLTDASITLNHIPGARIRAGLFKYPGAEEGLQAIHVFDYVNFTWGANTLLLERFPNTDLGGAPVNPTDPYNTGAAPNGFNGPVGAFRDVGVQLFDSFNTGAWEHSYAFMVGNGNGLNFTDDNDYKDTYLYWSSELVYGGQGPRREGLKLFAWRQSGKRTMDTDATVGTVDNKNYDRTRTGFGVKYLKNQLRATAEYFNADGMIFLGPHKQNFDMNAMGGAGDGREGKADAFYVEGGYYIPNSKWELDLRYDVLHRLTNDSANFQVDFTKTTLGVQYHFNKKTRLTMNYALREAQDDNNAALAGHFEGLGPRLAVQLTAIY